MPVSHPPKSIPDFPKSTFGDSGNGYNQTPTNMPLNILFKGGRLTEFRLWLISSEGGSVKKASASQTTTQVEVLMNFFDQDFIITELRKHINKITDFVDTKLKVYVPSTVMNYLRALRSYVEFLMAKELCDLLPEERERLLVKIKRLMKTLVKGDKQRQVEKGEIDRGLLIKIHCLIIVYLQQIPRIQNSLCESLTLLYKYSSILQCTL